MKKNCNESIFRTDDLASVDNSTRDFEILKSRVANAVLDYMEEQSDSNLIECLDKVSSFLTNISLQIEKVFDKQTQDIKDQTDLIEISDDLFLTDQETQSSTIH